eukprot:TRINITY_DN970_c0_g1_i1.p1 TRINITY_DN970_c0_g1~~TRINITY_DN970_c0_g1_i1.p1  ORF type:complete len:298 (-),score=86.61 TRINITY_DN970_c0_g1_i1:432-1325(-)
MSNKQNASAWKTVSPFVLGGLSGMWATTCIQPIDMVKVRIQLLGQGATVSPIGIAKEIIQKDGFGGLYRGLSAALLRQATYTTARLGMYKKVTAALEEPGKPLPLVYKAGSGLFAGAFGAMFGNPADLALVRMQADGTLPISQRRNYKNVGDALIRIVREEGVLSLWKGCIPTVARAMSLNMAMLASFDQSKEYLQEQIGKGFKAEFGASIISGFFASAFSLPFDFVKTRIQKQQPNADGSLPYKSSIDCVKKVLQQEGPMAFYKGFWTYYVRIAPHVMITLLTLEQLNRLSKKYLE